MMNSTKTIRRKIVTDYDDTKRMSLEKSCPDPNCLGFLEPDRISVSPFPYVHADVNLVCDHCATKYTFGIPAHHASGMTLYIYQNSGIPETLDHVPDEPPVCPFHEREMKLTKIFGNRAGKKHSWSYQYKCPECYLVKHLEKDGEELAPKDLENN